MRVIETHKLEYRCAVIKSGRVYCPSSALISVVEVVFEAMGSLFAGVTREGCCGLGIVAHVCISVGIFS